MRFKKSIRTYSGILNIASILVDENYFKSINNFYTEALSEFFVHWKLKDDFEKEICRRMIDSWDNKIKNHSEYDPYTNFSLSLSRYQLDKLYCITDEIYFDSISSVLKTATIFFLENWNGSIIAGRLGNISDQFIEKNEHGKLDYLIIRELYSIMDVLDNLIKFSEMDWLELGDNLSSLYEFDKAHKCYDQIIQKKPRYTRAYLKKGMLFEQMSDFDNALECFHEALEIEPGNEDIKELIAERASFYND